MYEKPEDRLKQIRHLDEKGWNLWKFSQDRVNEIRAGLWTIGTWLVALMGALLAFAHQGKVIQLQSEFPGVAVLEPWPAGFLAFAGVMLVVLLCSIVWYSSNHVLDNFAAADWLRTGVYSRASSLRSLKSIAGASALAVIALVFLFAFAGILALSIFSKPVGPAAQAAPASGPGKVTLLTINDVYRIGGVERGQRGGLARVRSLRRQLEAQDPELLLLHAGDVIYPSLLSRTYDGAQMIDVLNRLDGDRDGFDSRMFAVLGNHEFDKRKRPDAHILADRIGESQFTWLRSNVAFALDPEGVPEVTGQENLREWQIIETNGVDVGLFGLTTDVARPDYVVEIGDPLENARRFSRELRRHGVDLVVALTHLTVQQDITILEKLGTEGPDLIIGGHEHTKHQEEVEGRWVLKADAEAVGAWVVRVTPRSGRPPLVEAEYRRLAGDLPLPDEAVLQAVAEWHARHDEEFCRTKKESPGCLDVEIGEAATELVAAEEQIRSCETNFGDWIADQMRAAFPGAQAAFVNAGSLRLNQNIAEGPILRRDLAELFQYDNQLVQVEITGATLREAVENAIKDWPGNGRWLQISGFAFHHDQSDRSSPKVAELVLIEPDGTRLGLEDDKPVKVVTTDYLLGSRGDQGDRDYYDMLPKWDEDLAQERKSLHEVIKEAFKPGGKSEPIDPMIEQRIVQVADGQVVEEVPCVPAP